MPISKVADRATSNSNTASTTHDLSLSGMTVGNLLIVRISAQNAGGGGAASSLTPSNQTGTPVDIASRQTFTQNNDPGAASAGVTCHVVLFEITDTSGTIRLTFGQSIVVAAVAEEWTGLDALASVVVGTPVGANGVNSTNLGSATDASALAGNLVYAACAIEGPSGDSFTQDADTTNGSWTGLTRVGTTLATATDNQTIAGAYKIPNATGAQTYNPTNGTARDSATLILELAIAVVAPNQGSASGGIGWAGSATGAKAPAGAATGSIAWVGSATGARTSAGAATGAVAWVGSATGEQPAPPPNEGTATGSLSWSGTATGSRPAAGAATGAIDWVGTFDPLTDENGDPVLDENGDPIGTGGGAFGERVSAGSASGAVAWAGAATGARTSSGAIGGTLSWSGAATGEKNTSGAAAGAVAWVGGATGESPVPGINDGSASGGIVWSGTATGARMPAGSATGTLSWSGAATGARSVAGAAVGAISWVGTALGFSGASHPGTASSTVTAPSASSTVTAASATSTVAVATATSTVATATATSTVEINEARSLVEV